MQGAEATGAEGYSGIFHAGRADVVPTAETLNGPSDSKPAAQSHFSVTFHSNAVWTSSIPAVFSYWHRPKYLTKCKKKKKKRERQPEIWVKTEGIGGFYFDAACICIFFLPNYCKYIQVQLMLRCIFFRRMIFCKRGKLANLNFFIIPQKTKKNNLNLYRSDSLLLVVLTQHCCR